MSNSRSLPRRSSRAGWTTELITLLLLTALIVLLVDGLPREVFSPEPRASFSPSA